MKKFLLALAMFFTLAINAQTNNDLWIGVWEEETGDYYVVILNDEEEGYKFVNFSFIYPDLPDEYFISSNKYSLKTRVHNKDNDWNVNLSYTIVDKNTLSVEFSGDHKDTLLYYRKHIQ
tara:strand:+ start:213 stop:569 length:357 start_codon:yes stop_codon:yes gene_type:complete